MFYRSTPPIHLLFKACLSYVLCLPYFICASVQYPDFVENLSRITISIFPTSRTFAGDSCCLPPLCFEAEDQSSCDKKTPKSKSGIRFGLVDWSCSEYKVSGSSWVKQIRTYFQCICILVQWYMSSILIFSYISNLCNAAFLYHQYSKLQDSHDRKW